MTASRLSLRFRFRLLAGVLALHLLAAVILSVAPDLHALMHDHAHDEVHHCAVSEYHQGTILPIASTPFRTGLCQWVREAVRELHASGAMPLALVGERWERGPPLGVVLSLR